MVARYAASQHRLSTGAREVGGQKLDYRVGVNFPQRFQLGACRNSTAMPDTLNQRRKHLNDAIGVNPLGFGVEGGVMQSRTYRDVACFDRAIAQYRNYVEGSMIKEAAL